MSERYSKLFSLPENLYSSGSPVIIAAGALLKDSQTDKVIAQLKIQNISPNSIKAVKVRIHPFDIAGNPLGNDVEHMYLDLKASRDEYFGQKTPVILPDITTRSFSVIVSEVIFADNSVWRASEQLWERLPSPVTLDCVFKDPELVKQYRIKLGADCKYIPTKHEDIWCCACGKLNRQDEVVCHCCKKSFDLLKQIDIEEMRKEKDLRVFSEKEQEEKEAIVAKAKTQKNRRIAIVATTILIVLLLAAVLLPKYITHNTYNNAIALMKIGKYAEAASAFESIDGYKDSLLKMTLCELKLANAGDYISFGSYEQDNDKTNGAEKIEWLVLTKEASRVLIISKYGLARRPYNESHEDVTWETCSLREWLNDDFLNKAFTREEKVFISVASVPAGKNPDHNVSSGKTTQDRIFLLSISEAKTYFSNDSARQCKPSAYAKPRDGALGLNGNCTWWLRDPGHEQSSAVYVTSTGEIVTFGAYVYHTLGNNILVRPALWIDLNKLS